MRSKLIARGLASAPLGPRHRHRHQEFLRLLKKVAAAYPVVDLHVVCDNYATRKHADVRAWLAKNPASSCTSRRPDARGSISSSASSP